MLINVIKVHTILSIKICFINHILIKFKLYKLIVPNTNDLK